MCVLPLLLNESHLYIAPCLCAYCAYYHVENDILRMIIIVKNYKLKMIYYMLNMIIVHHVKNKCQPLFNYIALYPLHVSCISSHWWWRWSYSICFNKQKPKCISWSVKMVLGPIVAKSVRISTDTFLVQKVVQKNFMNPLTFKLATKQCNLTFQKPLLCFVF